MFPISDSIQSRGFPLFTIIIIAITAYVFFQELFSSHMQGFLYDYSLIPSQIDFTNPESLTPFVTSIFLHGGFLHIISNMWFLWVFGDNVEGYVGKFSFLIIYVIAGVIGNISQYLLMPHSPIPMLGASGAVAGILGAYYILFPHAKIKTIVPIFFLFTIIELSAPVMLGYWFVIQLIAGTISLPFLHSMTGGIAFWAHIGGFLTGAFLVKILMRRNIYSHG